MAQTVKLKRSAVSGNVPSTSDLALGEIAINTYDGKIFIKKNDGSESIVTFSAGGNAGSIEEDSFTGNGNTTAFTISTAPSTEENLLVFIDAAFQNRDSFTVSGTTVTFDTAPDNGSSVRIYHVIPGSVDDGILTVAKFAASAIVTEAEGISSNDNDTTIPTSAAVKDYVDTQVATVDTLPEVLANGNTTGGTDIAVSTGDDITFADSSKAIFGTDSDLELYHNGSNAFLTNTTGDLYIQDTNGSIRISPKTGESGIDVLADGAVNLYYDNTSVLSTTADGISVTSEVEADEFIGDLRGAVLFKAQAGENVTKGDVVYISGISGNTTVVSKADADDASKMPAFGIVAATTTSGQPVDIYTQGILGDLDTSAYSVGDELFVSTTAGALTNTAPTGETAALQKIAKVTRSNNLSGSIFITGAGRTNAVPNLDEDQFFLGNASNQAVATDFSDAVEALSINNVVEDITPQLGGDLASNGNDILFADNDKAIFGTGSDLQIWHESSTSNSYISEGGAGNLYISANNLRLTNYGITESYLQADANGAVTLYYDGSPKLATTSTGIDVTGTISSGKIGVNANTASYWSQANSLVLDASGNTGLTIKSTTTGNGRVVFTDTTSTTAGLNDGGQIHYNHPDDTMRIRTAGTDALTINSSQNATFAGTISSGAITSTGEVEATALDINGNGDISGNLTLGGYLAGPATFTIDPAAVGDNTGTVVIAGNLQVDGTTTTINSTTLTVDDKLVTLASGSINAAAADGAGIEVEISGATNPSLTYDGTNDEWDFNKNINVTGTITFDGGTTSADLNFGDDDKAIFGAGSDLQIYHTGANSVISDAGTGSLIITANQVAIKNAGNTENVAVFNENSDVRLFYDNSIKLATTSTGIDVTGTVTADGLIVDGNGVISDTNAAATGGYLWLKNLDATTNSKTALLFTNTTNSSFESGRIELNRTASGQEFNFYGNGNKVFTASNNGDISFYEDTGTTAKFEWDSSEESLTIGGGSTTQQTLRVTGAHASALSTGFDNQVVKVVNTSASKLAGIDFVAANTNGDAGTIARLGGFNTSSSSYLGEITLSTRDGTGMVERVRVDANGNVGIGVSSVTNSTDYVRVALGDVNGTVLENQVNGTATSRILTTASQTSLETLTATPLVFETNTAERMRIDSSGNVGIGTNNPTEELHVFNAGNTTVQIQTSGGGTPTLKFASPVGTEEITANVGSVRNMVFRIGGSERARIDSSGNVGIGTSSPQNNSGRTTLTLSNSTNGGILEIFGASDTRQLLIYNDTGESRFETLAGGSEDIVFRPNGSESVRFDSSGNVGIGTTASAGRLDVRKAQSTTAFTSPFLKLFPSSTTNTTGLTTITLGTSPVDNYGVSLSGWRYSTDGAPKFAIKMHNASAAGIDALTVDSVGNVGIGTTSPDVKLHLEDASRVDIKFEKTGSETHYIRKDGDFLRFRGHDDNTVLFELKNNTNGNNVCSFPNGNVAIGTSSPLTTGGTAKLSVIGILSVGLSNSDMSYIRRQSAGNYAWQTYDNTNTGSIQLQPYGGNVGIGTTSPSAKLQVEEYGIDTTETSTTATTQVAIHTMSATTFRSARFTVQVTNSTDSTYHLTEILMIHDGTTPSITEYGTIFTGSAEATFDADISSGNVRLLATPASTDTMEFKVVAHSITT